MTPEERIKTNVQAALGRQDKKLVKKQNLFVKGICKSASKTRSTDLAEIIEVCESLPVSDAECAALTLICAHNNTQVREHAIESAGDDIGAITPQQMSLATGEEYTAFDFSMMIVELMACGVLVLDDEGFYRVALYAE
ncbi:TPA: hypothetical protein ROA76_004366 [Escherichia coli]|nr:hypothetical protein [Escherichia coli]